MWRLAVPAALMASSPALACSRMLPIETIAPAALDRAAAQEIAASHAIVDAVVGPWTRRGLVLEVRKVWKGRLPSRIAVTPDSCGPSFPRRGSWVRVLLTRDPASGWWSARDPSLGGRVPDQRRLDRLIDRRLGPARPAHFAPVAGLSAPPPLP